MKPVISILLAATLLLVACGQPQPAPPTLSAFLTPLPSGTPIRPTQTSAPPLRLTSQPASSRVSGTKQPETFLVDTVPSHALEQASWTATPTLDPSAIPTPLVPVLDPLIELNPGSAEASSLDLIVFVSERPDVFPGLRLDQSDEAGGPQLYAISPDGRRFGRLSPARFQSAVYFPSDPSSKPLLVEYGLHFGSPSVRGIPLPPECYPPLVNPAVQGRFLPCDSFQFSPDGRYLGFFYGPDECWRAIIVMDTRTGAHLYQSQRPDGHHFTLLDRGKALIETGHCEGGWTSLFDLVTRQSLSLGEEGNKRWNSDHSALAVEATPYQGIESWIWGYNIRTGKRFLRAPETHQIDDEPVWAPDDQHLLFQHRTFVRGDRGEVTFDQPRQIILVDAKTGENQVLLFDPAYDFHLGGCFQGCKHWSGDWISVRRVAFTPQAITAGDTAIHRTPQYRCLIYAIECLSPVELFALNWKTGELIPSAEASWVGSTPTPSPTPVPGPDLVTAPIYAHPSGRYAFYLGLDGHSLWMVPSEGEPALWVQYGQNFFYIP